MRRALPLLVLAVLAAPAASALQVDAPPSLTVGDSWTARSNGTAPNGRPVNGTARSAVEAFEPVIVRDSPVETVRIVTESRSSYEVGKAALAVAVETTRTTWLRVSDRAIVKETTHTRTVVPGSPTVDAPPVEAVYDEPCRRYDWPLAVGKTWTSSCRGTRTSDGRSSPFASNESYTVAREDLVSVPAGTFPALAIENGTQGSPSSQREWFAPRACGVVRVEPGADRAPSGLAMELVGYVCAKEGAVVVPTPTSPPPSGGGADASDRGAPQVPAAFVVAVVAVLAAARKRG